MKVHINSPWWSAGSKYGWGDKIPGIGFKKKTIDKLIVKNEKVTVVVGSDPVRYKISPVTVRNVAMKYSALYTVRNNIVLYVIPQNVLRKDTEE